MKKIKFKILIINFLLLFGILNFLPLDPALSKGLGIFVFIAILWIMEVFHVSVTALMVPVLAVLLGVFDVTGALKNFANPIIFLFLGGFALASAMHKQELDLVIADSVLQLSRGNMLLASILVFILTAFTSMWISNTATVAMMLPLVLGLLSQLPFKENKSIYLYFLLGLAYSGSIGGMGTLVGSPPNAIAAAATGIGFAEWMRFGIPMVMISLPIMILVLYVILRPKLSKGVSIKQKDFSMTSGRKKVAIIFLLTVLCWIFSKPLKEALGVKGSIDAIVAIGAIIALCGTRVVSWKEVEKSADWGVLLLFGGGITLSAILKATGTSEFLANSVSDMMQGAAALFFILVTIAFVVFMTELASNTASTALLVPIFMTIADMMNFSSTVVAVCIALAASCAFMLPVATPPNAIVFGSGYIKQGDMMKTGIYLNLGFISLISAIAYLFV